MAALTSLPQIVTTSVSPDADRKVLSRHLEAAVALQSSQQRSLRSYYDSLFAAHGPQYWWPGRTRFEIIVGAILTQSTSWKNVELALANLRRAKLLSPPAIQKVSSAKLAKALRPSGYYRQKTRALKTFVAFLHDKHGGSFSRLFKLPTKILRRQLLSLRGIGPETADSILLYAGDHPVFVVDAYTRRIFGRHGMIGLKSTYEEIRWQFQSALPADQQLLNEFHALIVHTGKQFCRKTEPLCGVCPLNSLLPSAPAFQSHAQP